VIASVVPRRTAPLADVENPDVYLLSDKACNISSTVLTIDAGATA
jgi:hypothetical protein